MIKLQRSPQNPIITPNPDFKWEHDGAFNGCVAKGDDGYHMVYRALSSEQLQEGVTMRVSTVGYAFSTDGVTFGEHRQLFGPTEIWERFGCEDPRITFFNGKYYIFYTALSEYPFNAYGIKTAVAITRDFKFFEKHPVSTFNAKAMALFPDTVDGKMAALITINTDMPPAKICLATFDRERDIWAPYYWTEWYDNANDHILPLLKDMRDQVELGSPPIKTKDGWLVIYSYIKNYMSHEKEFGIDALLLDLDDPRHVIGRTDVPLLTPEEKYELEGDVPDVIFPSGALVNDGTLFVYYGAADTRCAVASCDLEKLLAELRAPEEHPKPPKPKVSDAPKLIRFPENPILTPKLEQEWQARNVFNPTAIAIDDNVHIIYRAQGINWTSVLGYASSKDGLHIDENFDNPIYIPRENSEMKANETGFSGCEDPRISRIGDKLYMLYTAYDGKNPPRVAMTNINVKDFLAHKWNWEKPKIISLSGVDDKDACIVKGKVEGTYLAFHRLGSSIWLEVANDLDFSEDHCLTGAVLAQARPDMWDNVKLGIAGPPLETKYGWLLLYHGVSDPDSVYKVGAMLLDYDDPTKILGRTDEPILEPEMEYEKVGDVPNVVFPCGAVIMKGTLYVYYGGADHVIGVATMQVEPLIHYLLGK